MKPGLRYLLHLLLLFAAAAGIARAQAADAGKFPVPYGPTNVGTEFWLAFPANWDYAADQKYIRLYINSGVETNVRVYAGPTLVKTIKTIPNDIVTVDLSLLQAQIFTRDDRSPVPPDQVYKKQAVHISADDPIVVYGINRITATSDGLLALPENALGKEYIIASARDITGGLQKLPSQYMIIAPYDGTTVSIFNSSQTPNHRAGDLVTIQLDSGDVYSAMSAEGTGGDLTGTFISATKPIAVTAGQNCTYLPTQFYPACDHLCEMMLPLSSWGTVYHSVPFANRTKGDLYRIFAGDPDAKVYINGVHIATLAQVGGDQGVGWLEYLPPDRQLLEFKSDKRIMIAQYNNSQTYDNVTKTDPMYLVLSPVEQFQDDLVFSTPGSDYGDNYINLVADSAAYWQIEIAKAGSGDYGLLRLRHPSVTRNFTTKLNGKTYVGVSFRIDPGTYHMRGPGPFAGYIYGFSNFDSYGYPLSAAVGDLSKNDSIPPVISKQQDCFGTVLGTVTDLPFEDDVRTNLSTIRLDRSQSTNYRLTVVPFIAGESPSTSWRLNVIDKSQDARAVVIFSDMRGNTTTDTVTFTSINVVVEPTQLDLENLFTGESKEGIITIRNLSSRRVTISETVLQKKDRGFTILDPTTSFTLDSAHLPGATRDVRIRFDATAAGLFIDSLGLRDDCGFRFYAQVRATVGTPIIKVTDFPFGTWPVTAPGPKPGQIEIRNESTDGGVLTVTGVAQPLTDAVTFTLPNGLPAWPLELPPGGSQTINVAFKPALVQDYIDSIVFRHNAPPNPANDSVGVLTGRGIIGSLIATSYDWGKKRVGTGPYPATVTLTNIGTAPVTLRLPLGYVSTPAGSSDFRVLNENALQNRVLSENESVDVQVEFSPNGTGDRTMEVTYPHTPQQDNAVTSMLRGFGTEPDLETFDYDFGSMDVGSMNETPMDVVFQLPPASLPTMDSVTIVRFDLTGDVTDFRYDPVALPIVLKPGAADVTIKAYFNAKAPGPRRAALRAVTAPTDNVDRTSNWSGIGLAKDALAVGTGVDFGIRCAEADTLNAEIENTGLVDLVITDMQLSNLPPAFRIDPTFTMPTPTSPITVAPEGRISVPIIFTASGMANPFTGSLVVANNSVNNSPLVLPITGATVAQDVDASVVLTAKGPGGKAELGRTFDAVVRLDEPIMQSIPVTQLRVTLTYDKDMAAPDVSKLFPASGPYASVTPAIASNTPGTLVVDLTSATPFQVSGDLFTIPFSVYFHESLIRTVSAEITQTQAGCLSFTTAPDGVDVVPICGLSLRIIELTGTTYALRQNSPNPFNPTTKITYSLGLDGRTQVLLHDASGRLVQTLVDEHQQPGTYELTLDVTNLPSGMYYYTLQSGHWRDTKTMMVAK